MEFQDVLKIRRSIRTYLPDSVPAEAIEKIKNAVELAPTACNLQPFKVFFVTDPALREKICGVYRTPWLAQAPAIAVVAGNYEECWKRLEGDPIADVDCAIVMASGPKRRRIKSIQERQSRCSRMPKVIDLPPLLPLQR